MVTERVSTLLTYIACFVLLEGIGAYEIPNVKFEVLSQGFRASIPDDKNIALFVFQGNLNGGISKNDVGSISGEVTQATNGRWVFEDTNIDLKVGDVINYYVFVSVNSVGYIKDNLSYKVSDRPDPVTQPPADCKPTLTRVRGGRACAGQTIFEDNFDSLSESVWIMEQYIPAAHPEHPYVSYQRQASPPTVSVKDGLLRIAPMLLQNQPSFSEETVYSGSLNLFSSCTGQANECLAESSGASILPPVVSGRITSKGLGFVYGTVHIRAKLPQGDWVYPELLLEPFSKRYGNLNYASGVIKIATARGNSDLKNGATDAGNSVLYGGPIMSSVCRNVLMHEKKKTDGSSWGDDFHVYSVTWTPDKMYLSVDGQEWAWVSLKPGVEALRDNFGPRCSDVPKSLLAFGSNMAPFDDFFYLTLGVAAGGITEFPDDSTSTGHPKPWRNQSPKAMLHFWQDMNAWYPSWTNTELLVDYVKVVAL